MMQIEVLQENLAQALTRLQRIIPSKPQLPILSTILFTAENNKITLAGTDLYIGMKTVVAGKIIEPGSIAIPGKIFHDSIASLDAGKLTLTFAEDTLKIKSSRNTATIQCLPTDEFPDFPAIEGQEYQLKAETIQEIQNFVSFSTSLDPTRPVLTALLFSFEKDGLLAVGTDGFRLATLKISDQTISQLQNFLIPAKAMAEVARISAQLEIEDVSFLVSEELKQSLFILGDTSLFVRMIEGEYPPFQKIIPSEFKTELVVDGKEFENQLKRAQVFARESSNIVKLQIGEKEMKIVAASPAFGSQEGEISIELIKGDGGEIAFNTRYLLDFINTTKAERIRFYMNESLTPALMRPEGKDEFKYIIMPFRVNE